jgi:hypothetical protein
MQELTTDLIGTACAVFLGLAYPGGAATIPPARRLFLELPPGQALADFLPQSTEARAACHPLRDRRGNVSGFAIRLGSAAFPHLKLKVQRLESGGKAALVFTVDTHDAFAPDRFEAPADHPEADAWKRLQQGNQRLKEKIEKAWEAAGFLTFNGLLRRELEQPPGGKL